MGHMESNCEIKQQYIKDKLCYYDDNGYIRMWDGGRPSPITPGVRVPMKQRIDEYLAKHPKPKLTPSSNPRQGTTNQDEVYYIEQAKEWQEAKEREDARNQYLTSILVQHGIAIPEGYATHDSNQLQNGMAASDAAYYMQGSSEAAMPKN